MMAEQASPHNTEISINSIDNLCVIEHLIKVPFNRRSYNEKLELVKMKRPTPEVKLFLEVKEKHREYVRHFTSSSYDKWKWLCGSSKLSKLFCWPCLLFSREANVWSNEGFTNMNSFRTAVQRHDKSKSHICSSISFATFGNARVDLQLDKQQAQDIEKHNILVKENRKILLRLINAACFLGKQELAFRGHDESMKSDNKGNYIEYLSSLSEFDTLLANHLQSSTVFRGTSPAIQNDLIFAISKEMISNIKSEIERALFVAIVIDETSDCSNQNQLSTVFRYVDNSGNVQERFIGFYNMSADKTAAALFHHVDSVVTEYNVGNKLIAQTYDGAAVMAGSTNGLKTKVQEKYPQALFVHCYSHVLNLVLQQTTYSISQCRIFFKTLSGLATFFSSSPKRSEKLKKFMTKKLPKVAPTRWNFTSRLVNTVKEYKEQIIGFFEDIIRDDCEDNWDADTVVQAQGYLYFFRQFLNIFLLEVYSRLFTHTDTLYNILQTKILDIAYCLQEINKLKNTVLEFRRNGFSSIWNSIETDNSSYNVAEPPLKRRKGDDELTFRQLFYSILDRMFMEINDRFSDYGKLNFTHLLDSKNFLIYKDNFPNETLHILLQSYNNHFDQVRLKNELSAIYSAEICDFSNKPIHEILTTIYQTQLCEIIPEVFKLATLIVTIPATSASVERTFSALKRIKSYCRSTQTQERLSGLALMSIEKSFLQKLRNQPNSTFNDKVIDIFSSQSRRIEITYK
jgi:hypothetical protein